MITTSRRGPAPVAVTRPHRRRVWPLRLSALLLAVGGSVASLALLPTTAQAARPANGRPLADLKLTPHSAVSVFCGKLSLSKISKLVGTTVRFTESADRAGILECIYIGLTPSTAKKPIDEVVISTTPKIPSSEAGSLAGAEAAAIAEQPKTDKLVLTALPSVGPTAFYWTYQHAVNGGQLAGIANNNGTTGWAAVVGGAATTFETAASHVPVLEKLLALAKAA